MPQSAGGPTRATPGAVRKDTGPGTAHPGGEEYERGMKAGADDFLGKPLDPDQLQARLRVAERIVSLERVVARLKGA